MQLKLARKKLDRIQEIFHFLQLSNLDKSFIHYNLTQTNSVIMEYSENGVVVGHRLHNIYDATDVVISKFHNLENTPMSEFNNYNTNYMDNKINICNHYLENLRKLTDSYVVEMKHWVDSKTSTYLVMLIMMSIIVFIALLVLLPFYFVSYTSQKQVLLLFLEIPMPKVHMRHYERAPRLIAQVTAT